MMYLLNLSLILFSLLPSPEQPRSVAAKPDVCRIYGQVYFEKGQPRDMGLPYFVVYQEQSDAFADLIVYKEDNKLFADGPGLWFETKERVSADFIVFLTDRRGLADFSVNFTDARSFLAHGVPAATLYSHVPPCGIPPGLHSAKDQRSRIDRTALPFIQDFLLTVIRAADRDGI